MFNLQSRIFNFFSPFESREDPFKDSEGKGITQRYHEMLAEDWDQNILGVLNQILDDTIVPETMKAEFIPYLEEMFGITPLVEDFEIRRMFVANWLSIMKVKGTLRSYEIVFRILGFTSIGIEELSFRQGFDSPVTFDDEQRRFDDNQCQTCSYYNLILEGPSIDENLYTLIVQATRLIEPINAKLYKIFYNGDELSFNIFVDENGDLRYYVQEGANIKFELINGELLMRAPNALNYVIRDGNLYENG